MHPLAALPLMALMTALAGCPEERPRGSGATPPVADAETDARDGELLARAPIDVVLVSRSGSIEQLALTLDPARPKGVMTMAGKPYELTAVVLELESASGDPMVSHAEYRLRFAIDGCAHAEPTPPGAWPGLCGYRTGNARPTLMQTYELRVSRESTGVGTVLTDILRAACVPRSGHGPSCALEGSVAVLSTGARTINGQAVTP